MIGGYFAGRSALSRASDGGVARSGGVGLQIEPAVIGQRLAPTQAAARSRDPRADGTLVERKTQAAEGRDRHGFGFRGVVHVAVAPNAQIEIELPALSGTNAFEVSLYGAPRFGTQNLLAAQIAKDRIRLIVATEGEQHGGMIQTHPVQVGAAFSEAFQELRRFCVAV